ncbi:MAG: threonine synthase [Deltaproteobacteria bacterium RBG_13_60_28]|nr:MAG: threonine synthase [Deltaproteobacteria bacterium RBG_13_60_28]
MKPQDFPEDIRPHLIPSPTGDMVYRCLECGGEHGIGELLYTCPKCRGLLLLEDRNQYLLREYPGTFWRRLFDYRKMLNVPALKGIFLYYELIAPVIPLEDIIYLGEGHTPQVAANDSLREEVGAAFYFKNDGQNPSASFKDRGMAAALSYLNFLVRQPGAGKMLAICASTGDTSAAAALYSAYLGEQVASAVLLPHGKVTPQQLAQPLGSGAKVLEIPGVFDDCMQVVESLADHYQVALLNSKNPWRIRGQESYAYEIAQYFDYELEDKVVAVPIGNAGNITAIMQGFIRLQELGIIGELPRVLGVQSRHANPVFRYYLEPDKAKRVFKPVTVQPSVAQAAMIGAPVSMPRVIRLVEEYTRRAGAGAVAVVEVTEQEIMDSMLLANRHGHIACTQGGESLAGYRAAIKEGLLGKDEIGVLDATAHHLKFIGFQQMYFDDTFPPEFEVTPKSEYQNRPQLLKPRTKDPEKKTQDLAEQIAALLGLTPKGD